MATKKNNPAEESAWEKVLDVIGFLVLGLLFVIAGIGIIQSVLEWAGIIPPLEFAEPNVEYSPVFAVLAFFWGLAMVGVGIAVFKYRVFFKG